MNTLKPNQDPKKLSEELLNYVPLIFNSEKREYDNYWCKTNTKDIIKYPVIYALWLSANDKNPVYIGQSIDVGRRFWVHFDVDYWGEFKPKYASIIESEKFVDPWFLTLVERFLITVIRPRKNDPKK